MDAQGWTSENILSQEWHGEWSFMSYAPSRHLWEPIYAKQPRDYGMISNQRTILSLLISSYNLKGNKRKNILSRDKEHDTTSPSWPNCTFENRRICISKPWLLKCQSMMTEKMFLIVSVLNESMEMMLKCLRNRGVISFLPPPGGPMADTSNWSTSLSTDVSFLSIKSKEQCQFNVSSASILKKPSYFTGFTLTTCKNKVSPFCIPETYVLHITNMIGRF